jgi:hypothetical protein
MAVTLYKIDVNFDYWPKDGGNGLLDVYHYFWMADEHGKVSVPDLPTAHYRSRADHDPGSGNYENRWAHSKELSYEWIGSPGRDFCPCIIGSRERNFAVDSRPREVYRAAGYYMTYGYVVWIDEIGDYPAIYPQRHGYRASQNLLVFNSQKTNGGYVQYQSIGKSPKVFWDDVTGSKELSYRYAMDRCYDFVRTEYDPSQYPSDSIKAQIYSGIQVSSALAQLSERPLWGINTSSLIGNAYINAVDNLPSLSSMNNIANIADVLGVIKDLAFGIVGGDPILVTEGIAGTLKEAWLAYRYAYSTTKSDVEELATYCDRLIELMDIPKIRSNGTAAHHGEYHGKSDDVLARCVIYLTPEELNSIFLPIEKCGLQLNSYNAWDLVPFSFMIDWFTGIGNALEWGEKRKIAFRVNPSDCWTSIERHFVNEFGFEEDAYFRNQGVPDLTRTVYPGKGHSTKGVTIVKRALDALAIFG